MKNKLAFSETLKLLPKKNLFKYSVHPESASMLSYIVVLQGVFHFPYIPQIVKIYQERIKPDIFGISTFFYWGGGGLSRKCIYFVL